MNDYDVSVFIINERDEYIPLYEYEPRFDGKGDFICLTNDELNSDFGENNSICIYRHWVKETKRAIKQMKGCGVRYKQDLCIWSKTYGKIPNNDAFATRLDENQPFLCDDVFYKRYLNGYLSCKNIMSNITLLYLDDNDTKEISIPAIMTSYHTKVEHCGQIYRGYLPAIGQLIYIYQNTHFLVDAMNLIKGNGFELFYSCWSSTENGERQCWTSSSTEREIMNKCLQYCQVLPLFKL